MNPKAASGRPADVTIPFSVHLFVYRLAVLALILVTLSVARDVAAFRTGATHDSFGWKFFSVDFEANLPTVFSAFILLAAAFTALFVA